MNAQGRVIGGYTLRRVLGRGGMGEVHLASTPTGGLAAVKVIHPELARDPAFRRRFEREVAAARRVARFCTAPVLDAGMDGDLAYLVTEYVKGPDLALAVREQGPLQGSNLEALAVGIATALHAIHGAGVIHRDLKPSNVLLSPLGPRVIDFGIAQLVDADSLASQAILGTPAFMAPEQVRGEALSPATDVYAWGGVIAFAGTGRLPFGGGAPAEVLYRIVNDGPALDGLDQRMRGLVEWAMAKDPARRPTAQQLLAELVGGQPSPESATQVVERTWTANDRPPAPARRRRKWPWAVTAGVAAVAVAVPAVMWFSSRQEWPYRAGFGESWAVGATEGGTAQRSGNAYLLTANPGWRLWKSAPVTEPAEGVVVAARARLEAGSGDFGVWCRGTGGGARYEFAVTADGHASITKRVAGGGKPVVLYGPAKVKAAKDVRIAAECRADGERVALKMTVGGDVAGQASDADHPYAAGLTGVHAAPGDANPLRVRFTEFTAQPVKG